MYSRKMRSAALMLAVAASDHGQQPPSYPAVESPPTSDPLLGGLAAAVIALVLLVGICKCIGRCRSGPPRCNPRDLGLRPTVFTYEKLHEATGGFSESNKLGEGGFGTVYKGVLKNGETVAVKKLKSGAPLLAKQVLENELKIISQLSHRHRNIVSLRGYYIDEDEERGKDMLLVYEFIPNDSLQSHLHGEGKKAIDWKTRMEIAIGSAEGLAYLHDNCEHKIIHRDVKPHNILLHNDFEPTIADFGLARLFPHNATHVWSSKLMGTFGYMAPELGEGKISEKSDVYAFGIVLLELITGRKPLENVTGGECLVRRARSRLLEALEPGHGNLETLADPRLRNNYNRDKMRGMVSCAARCIHPSAESRPRMREVVKVLKEIQCSSNERAKKEPKPLAKEEPQPPAKEGRQRKPIAKTAKKTAEASSEKKEDIGKIRHHCGV